MVTKKSWAEFRATGLLLIINQLLHVFGWAIVLQFDDTGNIEEVYPARVKYRGFDEKSISESYIKVSEYLKENIDTLVQEAKE